jgi:hypothetical protein
VNGRRLAAGGWRQCTKLPDLAGAVDINVISFMPGGFAKVAGHFAFAAWAGDAIESFQVNRGWRGFSRRCGEGVLNAIDSKTIDDVLFDRNMFLRTN